MARVQSFSAASTLVVVLVFGAGVFQMFSTQSAAQRENAAPQRTILLMPGQDVARIVENSPEETTFVFSPGIYRMQSIVPKNGDVFEGQQGAVLNGAKALTMHREGEYWTADAAFAPAAQPHCQKDHPLCWITSDLFIDGQLQEPARSLQDLAAGRWYYDQAAGKILIATNPAGHLVEMSNAQAAFSGGAARVAIRNLVVEKYASPMQHGAIGGNNGKAVAWTITNTEVRWNHGVGIAIGPNSHVEHCNIHHNGQMGIAGNGNNLAIISNEIAFNNYAGYDPDWEAGGSKFSGSDNLVVRSNMVHDNQGNGLWTDIDNIHVLFEDNQVYRNSGEGIRHEISYDAVIRRNTVVANSMGIVVALSSNTEVYENRIEVPAKGKAGIRIAGGSRGQGAYGPHLAHDIRVHDNVFQFLGQDARCGVSTSSLATVSNITFDNNQYHILGGGQKFWNWGDRSMDFAEFRNSGQESHGSLSTARYSFPASMQPN